MKKIIALIAIMSLVSSCSLLKKKSKTVESEKYETVTTMQGDFRHDHQTQIKKKEDVQSIVALDGEFRTEFEGEDITREKNGSVRIGKGKVIIQEITRSNTMQLASRVDDINNSEKNQASLETGQKVVFKSESSNQISTPQYRVFIWFSAGLILLIFIWFRWIKKSIR
jgi:hypothetical protein